MIYTAGTKMEKVVYSLRILLLFCTLCCLWSCKGEYQYDVTLETGGTSKSSLIRQHYLSESNTFPTNDNFLRFRLKGIGCRFFLESVDKFALERKIFYYILISGWKNSKSAILLVNKTFSAENNFAAHNMTEVYASLLSNSTFRDFWMSWCGEIKFGSGTEPNKNLVMSCRNPCSFKIVDIAVASGYNCSWKFQSKALRSSIKECNICNTQTQDCPTKKSSSFFTRNPACLKFIPLNSVRASGLECACSCSTDVHCWAWTQSTDSNKCELLSGNVEQTSERMTCFLKH